MATRLTDEGRKAIKRNPERIREVNKEVENMGAKLLSQYAILGTYDFLNVLEASSDEIVFKISLELGARGTLKVETFRALPVDEIIESMK